MTESLVGARRFFDKHKQWLPALVSIVLLSVAIVVLHHSLAGVRIVEVKIHFAAIGIDHVAVALALTAVSYLLLTLYDYLALHHVSFPMAWKQMAPTSFNACAVGHNVGFATLSGGAIRYRAYSAAGLEAPRIAEVILFCFATFTLGASLLLGLSLVLEPITMLQSLPINVGVSRAIGWVLLIVPILYVLFSLKPGITLGWSQWKFSLPKPRIAFAQVALGAADLTVAAMVLYVLLPPDLSISFLSFLGIYLICIAIAVISTVPGGVGVFEGGMLLLLHGAPKPELLASLLAFRFLYYLIPFILALSLLAIQMSLANRAKVNNALSRGSLILTQAAPQLITGAVFVAGAALLFSGSLPSDTARIRYVGELLPDFLVQVSHLLGSVIGLTLLILARGLYRRLEGAFWLTLLLLGIGIITTLTKGFDYYEALFLGLVAGFLWAGRKEFDRKASILEEPFTGGWFISIAMVVGAAVWLGFFSYRHVEYQPSMWWNFAVDRDAPKMLRASVVSVVLLLTFGLFRLTRTSSRLSQPATAQDVQLASEIIKKGSSAVACVALTGDKRFLFHPSNDAFIMYQIWGNSAIAMGDPVGISTHFSSLVWLYRELCDKLDKRCVFYQVGKQNLPLYIDLGLAFSKLGEEAIIPLVNFTLDGPKRAEFRQAKNKAARAGASFEIIPATSDQSLLAELKIVSNSWLESKNAKEKGFSVGRFNNDYLAHCDIAVVRVESKVVAFANLWIAGDKSELTIDLMRQLDTAPKGIMDYLFTELMLWGKDNGYSYFSLGMAPLSGLEDHELTSRWNKFGNLIYRYADEFYNFDGLRKYKQKYDPQWEPRYLAASGGVGMARSIIDVTSLISGGVGATFKR